MTKHIQIDGMSVEHYIESVDGALDSLNALVSEHTELLGVISNSLANNTLAIGALQKQLDQLSRRISQLEHPSNGLRAKPQDEQAAEFIPDYAFDNSPCDVLADELFYA